MIDMCREKGVVRLVHAGTEIVLGPAPGKLTKSEPDPHATRREHYATMLGRPVSNKELEQLP